jgi:hypothetical protein
MFRLLLISVFVILLNLVHVQPNQSQITPTLNPKNTVEECYKTPAYIAVSVVEGANTYTVDITTRGCGNLYSLNAGSSFGWHMLSVDASENVNFENVVRVPNGPTDINYAPREFRVYCFVTKASAPLSIACSAPLGKWMPYKQYFPIVVKG